MESNRTVKIVIILILFIVVVQFVITLLSRGDANSAIREMKAARESLGKAIETLEEARSSINLLTLQLDSARADLHALDYQVEQLDRDMRTRLAAVDKRLNTTLSDIRKESKTIVDLQKKLSTLEYHE